MGLNYEDVTAGGVCRPCQGHGVLATPHVRAITRADNSPSDTRKTVLTLLVQCPHCEGHGMELVGEDRNLIH